MAHTIYENVVIANKINEVLKTKVDLNNYMTIDTSLTQEAGMQKLVNVYTATGGVKEVDMGEGNNGEGTAVTFERRPYDVKTAQGYFQYFDEEEMTDPMVVDAGIDGVTKELVNHFTDKAIAEFEKAKAVDGTHAAWSFDVVADGIGEMALEAEDGLFLLISPADKAAFRKALKDDLKYSEGFVRTGYIGTVCGVPVIVSKAVPAGKGYLATADAVTLFIKKDTEVEQDRDKDLRLNKYWVRKVAVVALTDATKARKIVIG